MDPVHHHLNICNFKVVTHLGRQWRLGAHKEKRILDLNFATAWYLAQTGEPEPQSLADALVPPSVMGYLQAGLRASHTVEELFLGSGPHPAQWWLYSPPPRGPNDETLVYADTEVSLIGLTGTEQSWNGPVNCHWEMAAVIAAGAAGAPMLGGYTLVIRAGDRKILGPYLITPNQIPQPSRIQWVARVNGVERARGAVESDLKIADSSLRPGDLTGSGVLGSVSLEPGDVIELEAEKMGVLRQQITSPAPISAITGERSRTGSPKE
jgi:hypothetical protein